MYNRLHKCEVYEIILAVDFVVVQVVHPLIIALQFLMHIQLAQSGMLGFHHYQLASRVHTCMSEKIPLPHFPGHFIIIIA